jgi:hypothetical protein
MKAIQLSDVALILKSGYAPALSAKACRMALIGNFEKAIQLEEKASLNSNYAKNREL